MAEESFPPLYKLVPGSLAASCLLSHLSKHEKQQFSLVCKHAYTVASAAVTGLRLGHKCVKWLKSTPKCKGLPIRRPEFPHCTSVALHPRTVDELSLLASELLLHQVKHLPKLLELRLELQGVYDKHYDLSLIIKSVPLHTAQITSLYVKQSAMLSSKAVAAMAEMPLLSSLTLTNAHGFEPGALAKLASMTNLTCLHLEIIDGSSLTNPAPAVAATNITPSELARLHASDEVGLAKCTKLVSLTAVNLIKAGAFRPVEALLQAIAGSLKPKLSSLVLGNMPELPVNVLDVVAGIPSLSCVSLAGCDVAGSSEVGKLACLAALTELDLSPQQPPSAALSAITKGCKHIASMAIGSVQLGPGVMPMPGITHLVLSAASTFPAAKAAAGSSSFNSNNNVTSGLGSMSLRVRAPVQITGVARVWPELKALEITGWAVDAAGVAAIKQLEGLTSLKLRGGSEAGAALHAKQLLPLLELPRLQHLLLLELADLSDDWVVEAVRNAGAAGGGSGSFSAVTELHLGSAAAFVSTTSASSGTSSGTSSKSSSTTGSKEAVDNSAKAVDLAAAAAAAAAACNGSQMLTDRGLVRLFACPRLRKLVLVQLPGITLAGVKALVRGSNLLTEMECVRCPAISAATPDVIARASVAAPDKAVDLFVVE